MKKPINGKRRVPAFNRIDVDGQLWDVFDAGVLEWYIQRWDAVDESWKDREASHLAVDLYFQELWDEWDEYQADLADAILDEYYRERK